MDLSVRHDTLCEKCCKRSDINNETVGVPCSAITRTSHSDQSDTLDLRTTKNCCVSVHRAGEKTDYMQNGLRNQI